MITSEVTKEQLEKWRELHNLWKDKLKANRISGTELDEYFRGKYNPADNDDETFRETAYLNSKAYSPDVSVYEIRTYTIDNDVYVGIELTTGFFHVECENIDKAIPIWDDLFIKRGLSADDIENYVLTGQYVTLRELEDKMNYTIRKISENEYKLLDDFI